MIWNTGLQGRIGLICDDVKREDGAGDGAQHTGTMRQYLTHLDCFEYCIDMVYDPSTLTGMILYFWNETRMGRHLPCHQNARVVVCFMFLI